MKRDKVWKSCVLCKIVSLVLFGCVLFSLGVWLMAVFSGKFQAIMKENLVLSPTSPGFPVWLDTPLPIYMKCYLFNLTNADEVFHNRSKPILEEVGPFVFREYRKKILVTFHNNETVSFRQLKWYEFQEDLSAFPLDAMITTINAPAMTAAYLVRTESFWTQVTLEGALKSNKERVFVTHPAGHFIFEGIESGILRFAKTMEAFSGQKVPFDKFAWLMGKNHTDDGVYNVYTGKNNLTRLGEVHTWNFLKQNSCWKSHCGMINGSTGELFQPNRDTSKPIQIYAADLRRTLSLEYSKDTEFEGISGARYVIGPKLFANGTLNPDNSCFDPPGGIPTGVLDVGNCQFGAPVYLSLPHFLHADPLYAEALEGIEPDEGRHAGEIILNPELGIPVRASLKLQMNVMVSSVAGVATFNNVSKVLLPVMWFELVAQLDEKTASQIKLVLYAVPLVAGILIPLLMIFFAAGFIAWSFVIFRNRMRKQKVRTKPVDPNGQQYAPMIKMKEVSGAEKA